MQLNVATDYAFRLVLHLAMLGDGKIANGASISEQENIPPRFLLKIVRYLTKAGIVKSYRGVDGGFALAQPAANISLFDVIKAMEGPITLNRCLQDREACSKDATQQCPIHHSLAKAQAQLINSLAMVSFDRLADEYRK